MEVSDQLRGSAVLSPGEINPRYLLEKRLGEPQRKSELWTREKFLSLTRNRTSAAHPIEER
jgi:hypothetical protein